MTLLLIRPIRISLPRSFASKTIAIRFNSSSSSTPPDQPASYAEQKQKQKADWKRRQSGSNFVDTLSITVTSGRGGAGGVAFHREKFKARGPPSGGPGGSGGSVYLIATPTVTSLSHLPRTVRGGVGASGGGKWLAGKRGEDVVIRVPVGTVVRELDERIKTEEEEEKEREERQGLEWAWKVNKVRLHEAEARDKKWTEWKKVRDVQEKFGVKANEEPIGPWIEKEEQEFDEEMIEALAQFRKRMFTMYPQAELTGHPSFLATEHHLLSKILSREVELPGIKKPRRRRRHSKSRKEEEEEPLLHLDLTRPTPIDEPILLVSGGQPGLGNPSFLTHQDRSPKYATKGGAGETMRLSLEVKSNGEVGLVGLPNAGKSTLLRALTSSTPRVASFAFTTLNPHLGTCVVYSDGTFSGPRHDPASSSSISSLSDTPSVPTHFSGHSLPSTDQPTTINSKEKKEEALRFTITDNPGLLPNSHLNHGLGHEFLRHIERCTSLVYVVDLSTTTSSSEEEGEEGEEGKMDPVESLKVLENSLREYEKVRGLPEGELVRRVKGVVGNKADLFGQGGEGEGGEKESVEMGKKRLTDLQEYVKTLPRTEEGEEAPMWVVPISAKNRQNVGVLVKQLSKDVELEREKKKERLEREEAEGAIEEDDEEYNRWVR
ncbi:putative GTPase MTG2 [Sporobolomyces salmoneus]|uniref:putative GTPase MTG2 n=1 Tax=Sporobolomyces salmoneus TaxID=183962 RepID=UPI00317B64A2